jgi:membrane protease YdiL (CAAX protease family)
MPRRGSNLTWLLWAYLFLITLAELITAVFNPVAGLLLHTALLVGLLCHSGITEDKGMAALTLALTLAPMIRLLSLSLPLLRLPQISWYIIVAVPLLLSAALIVRQLKLRRKDLGLCLKAPHVQLPIMGLGLLLGVVEYAILKPQPLIAQLRWDALWLPALVLLLGTGFNEELIFRGLFQTVARGALGKWAICYVALLFAVLHIGYLSLVDVLFVFIVGMLFGWFANVTGSLLGVVIAHGIANIMLFLVMPFVMHVLDPGARDLVSLLIVAEGLIMVVMMSVIVLKQVWLRPAEALRAELEQFDAERQARRSQIIRY